MKPGFDKLFAPLALALGLIAISALLLWLAHRQLAQATGLRKAADQHVQTESDRYRHTAQDETLIRETIARFDNLRARGLIGQEQRLDWSDSLRKLRASRHIARLDYELGPLKDSAALSPANDYHLASSTMKLSAGLLHEGDFFELVAGLRDIPSAIVAPRQCTLSPVKDAGNSVNLRAECTIDWLTVSPKAEKS